MKNNILGKNLKSYRIAAGKLQKDVADFLCVEKTRITNWETGKTEPDLDMLVLLAKFFDITVNELLEEI